MKRHIIGPVEAIVVEGPEKAEKVKAKMDTGADRTAIDARLATRLGLGPTLRMISIRAAGRGDPHRRALVRARIILHGEAFKLKVGVVDRSEMNYAAIVGRDILASGKFLIDPALTEEKSKKTSKGI